MVGVVGMARVRGRRPSSSPAAKQGARVPPASSPASSPSPPAHLSCPLAHPCFFFSPLQTLADRLPDWMGYGFLYLVSAIPVLIAGSVIAILFFNSLR